MNITQWVIGGLGLVIIAGVWIFPVINSDRLDIPFSIIVTVLAAALAAGFVFSAKDVGKKPDDR